MKLISENMVPPHFPPQEKKLSMYDMCLAIMQHPKASIRYKIEVEDQEKSESIQYLGEQIEKIYNDFFNNFHQETLPSDDIEFIHEELSKECLKENILGSGDDFMEDIGDSMLIEFIDEAVVVEEQPMEESIDVVLKKELVVPLEASWEEKEPEELLFGWKNSFLFFDPFMED
ncbi:hypothetical protein PTKIN_Ptkin16aG0022900 [Pterospermum kingtungense]